MGSRAIKGRHNVKKKNGKAIVLGVLAVCVAFVVVACVGAYALCTSWLQDLPDYKSADAYNTAQPTKVYASDGTTLLAEFELENRDPVTIDQISGYVLAGTVATEDERFYEHNGIDLMGIARAVVNNLMGGSLEGASTITQQFVRNTVLSGEMNEISFKRKVREMHIALKLEEQYSKDEILLMYLNTINYGSGAYGIEAASQRYYSKSAADLSIAEAATLIGIPQSPTYNNPIDNPDNCLNRRNVVLQRMLSNGVISQEEHDAAVSEPISLNPTKPSETGIVAYPYFTSYVRNQLTDADGRYAYSTAEVFKGGLTIVTTLDLDVQQAAEDAAAWKENGSSVFECSIVAINPDNGHIEAMVGGKDYDATQVNMATGEGGMGRQAGSTFKTFTLVAAIEQGIDPDTMIDASAKADLPGWASGQLANINNAEYGTRSIERAFWVSSNTAFARLCCSIGPSAVVEMAHRLGIKSDLPEVNSVTLGVGSVTPLEMANAYATIANGGVYYEAECIATITDRNGNVIVDNTNPEGERVISEEVAGAAIDVMKGVITSGTGKAASLSNGQVAAGKTGTTDDYKDSWFCGFTPQYSVAIWYGDRSDYSKAKTVSGSCAGVFSKFMNKVLSGQPKEKFFEHGDPVYIEGFTDETYHIGGWYGDGEDEADENPLDEMPTEGADSENPGTAAGDASAGGSGGSDEGSGSGGSDGGAGTGSGTGAGSGSGGTGGSAGGSGSGEDSGSGAA